MKLRRERRILTAPCTNGESKQAKHVCLEDHNRRRDVRAYLGNKTMKEAWDTFVMLFSKKNDTMLQLLENKLLSISQRDMTISQYFHKVKTIYREITKLDPKSAIGEDRMKRIIMHGLQPEYRSYVVAIQGWSTQPSLVGFENLLASQKVIKELNNLRELRRTTTRVLKERNLEVFSTSVGKRATHVQELLIQEKLC